VTGHGEPTRCERALRFAVECENAPSRCYAFAQRRETCGRRRARAAPRGLPHARQPGGTPPPGTENRRGANARFASPSNARAPRRRCYPHASAGEKRAGAGEEHARRRAVPARARESGGRGVAGHREPARCETRGFASARKRTPGAAAATRLRSVGEKRPGAGHTS
jgi:hypothetical protein